MKVAFVYDRVNKWGGAERVLLALHEIFPEAELYTSVYHADTAKWASVFRIHPSFLQHIPLAKTAHEWFPMLMPLAFESFTFDDFDLVISLSSEAAKGVITKPPVKHLCICLTPTRYLWTGYLRYFPNPIVRFLLVPLISYLRTWDKIAAFRPDRLIAISQEVQSRIKTYYHRDSTIIYPPLLLDISERNEKNRTDSEQGYFLIVSRLVPVKRIDIAIKACNILSLPLSIIGTGSELKSLQRIAGPSISFLGNLTDSDLVRYYKGCCALLFPGIEDFGLTIVESQHFGKPVIAFRAGGAVEIIKEGVTGEFFYHQDPNVLAQKLQLLLKERKIIITQQEQPYYERACKQYAQKFTKEIFKEQLLLEINTLMREK